MLKHVNDTYGYRQPSHRWDMTAAVGAKYSGGKYSFISRRIDQYTVIFPIIWAITDVFWIFNEEGRLVEIRVHKYEDAIGG